jgi:hypothetical protein
MFMLLIAREFCLSRRKEAGKLPDTPIIGCPFRHLVSVPKKYFEKRLFLEIENIVKSEWSLVS